MCVFCTFVASPPHGEYTSAMIRVRNTNGYADIDPSVTVTATAELTSISPEVGSIYGGLAVQIDGSGFHPMATTVNVSFLPLF